MWTVNITDGIVRAQAGPSGPAVSLSPRDALGLLGGLSTAQAEITAAVRGQVGRAARKEAADYIQNTDIQPAAATYEDGEFWVIPLTQEHLDEAAAYKTPDAVGRDADGALEWITKGALKAVRVADEVSA